MSDRLQSLINGNNNNEKKEKFYYIHSPANAACSAFLCV